MRISADIYGIEKRALIIRPVRTKRAAGVRPLARSAAPPHARRYDLPVTRPHSSNRVAEIIHIYMQ